MQFWRYFQASFLFTILGLLLAFFLGYEFGGTILAGLSAVWIAGILAVLETSLSFDNAVVNATVLKDMTPLWKHRFLTWGMLIAVFGMRIVFPLAIVGITAHVNPWDALVMAAQRPDDYATLMKSAHVPVASFGGAFLLMVFLRYFFDTNKETHWLGPVERTLSTLGKLESIELALALAIVMSLATMLPPEDVVRFVLASLAGLVVFILVDGSSLLLRARGVDVDVNDVHRASAAMFLYLEVLDASFSFDGVIGAFALTNNLFIIAIGLAIGAMFVRSLTILLVDNGTLTAYRYLEHGAFWAIGILATVMYASLLWHIPEAVTGLTGAACIGLSLISSIRYNRRHGRTSLSAQTEAR